MCRSFVGKTCYSSLEVVEKLEEIFIFIRAENCDCIFMVLVRCCGQA